MIQPYLRMFFFDLVISACSAEVPEQCQQVYIPVPHERACIALAPHILDNWLKANPLYRLRKWTCKPVEAEQDI